MILTNVSARPIASSKSLVMLKPSITPLSSYTITRLQCQLSKPSNLHRQLPMRAVSQQQQSTFSSTAPSSASSTTSSSSPEAPESTTLTWNEFLRLRKERRRYNTVSSVGTALLSTTFGISILAQQEIDPVGGQLFGLDPYVVLGLATAGFGVAGWLAGPLLGNTIFNMTKSRYRAQIAAVSLQLLSLIAKHFYSIQMDP
jgi:import inner membrane translocase subunit TIM23